MEPEQLALLKADILADPVLSQWAAAGNMAWEISQAYSLPAAPDWTVWKSAVTWDEIMLNGMDWQQVDNLTNGSKYRIWEWMFKNASNSINPSRQNIRAGIDATWAGTQPMLAVRASVYTHCKRLANRIEKLLSTGTGSTASPATMGHEGSITYQDVEAALRLP